MLDNFKRHQNYSCIANNSTSYDQVTDQNTRIPEAIKEIIQDSNEHSSEG